MKLWMKAALALAAVWLVATTGVLVGRALKPTPASIQRYIERHPLPAASAQDRAKIIDAVAERINGLKFDERRQLRSEGGLDAFFEAMTPDEQSRFLDLTLPEGFRQMMRVFNEMEPDKRRRFVERALRDIEQDGPGEPPPLDEEQTRKIVEHGLSAFYEEANADVKLDFAPLIEQMQRSMQGL
jgi:hypothetical protein